MRVKYCRIVIRLLLLPYDDACPFQIYPTSWLAVLYANYNCLVTALFFLFFDCLPLSAWSTGDSVNQSDFDGVQTTIVSSLTDTTRRTDFIAW